LGNAETEEGRAPATQLRRFCGHALPQRTTRNFILFERFQIAFASRLDRYHSARNWHRPGGCQPIPKK
jgi:hypothetical protein